MIESAITQVESGKDLSLEQMARTIGQIMEGNVAEDSIQRLLVGLHVKGESGTEVAGAAMAMRDRMTRIRTRHPWVLDIVGTGGCGSRTFNISTTAALVTAAAGVPVAKHGNRSFTSRTGSADVLGALGVNLDADVLQVEACLDELGLCYCFAPLMHRAMKHVAAVRRRISTATIFNIVGPLANPASASRQLVGVGRPELRPLVSEALFQLETERALVLHSCDRMDEVTLAGATYITEVTPQGLRCFEWTPADFGLEESDSDALIVSGPDESAALIRRILSGESGPPRNIVLANAAAALFTAGRSADLLECVGIAAESIDSGAAEQLLTELIKRSHAP